MFPVDVLKNTRFSTNYFTSIGLGVVTEDMRDFLKVGFYFPPHFDQMLNLLNLECSEIDHGTTPSEA